MRNPGNDGSTRNAVTPRAPACGSVLAKTRYTPDTPPLLTQALVPFKTYESPSRTARVWIPAASEPACGSVRQNAPRISPRERRVRYFFFCASLPNFQTGTPTTELVTLIATAVDAQTRATSSSIRA